MTISAVEATRNIDREDAIGGAGEPFDDAPPPGMHRVLRPVLVANDPADTFVTDRPPSNRSMGEAILGQHTKLDECHSDALRAVNRGIVRKGRDPANPTDDDSNVLLAIRDLLAGMEGKA